MNRRDFIGAAIGTLVAALALPFEEFAAWCKRWLTRERLIELDNMVVFGTGAMFDKVGMDLALTDSLGRTSHCVITKVDRLRGTITVSG